MDQDLFDVFVERARDTSEEGQRRLAQQLAKAFRIDSGEAEARLKNGRFRVKPRAFRPDCCTTSRTGRP